MAVWDQERSKSTAGVQWECQHCNYSFRLPNQRTKGTRTAELILRPIPFVITGQ